MTLMADSIFLLHHNGVVAVVVSLCNGVAVHDSLIFETLAFTYHLVRKRKVTNAWCLFSFEM